MQNVEIESAANEAVLRLGPTKSGDKYCAAYDQFLEWCKSMNATEYRENVLLAYFNKMEKEKKWKSSTMWSRYSMIKSQVLIKQGVDISQYLKLRALLKKAGEGYVAKKSNVFTKEQFKSFLSEAPDESYLGLKIVLLIGISGACRCDEMLKMRIEDIEDMENVILIKIPDSKTRKVRSFTIIGEAYIKVYKKYAALRPQNMSEKRFFLKYQKGKCFRSVMGIHAISSVPEKVANFLKLSNAKEFTGHALRRTSATLLVDGGGNIESLKRHGGWKSSTVAEGYVEESMRNKTENAKKILNINNSPQPGTSKEQSAVTISQPQPGSSRKEQTLVSISSQETEKTILRGFNFQRATLNNCTFNIKLATNDV